MRAAFVAGTMNRKAFVGMTVEQYVGAFKKAAAQFDKPFDVSMSTAYWHRFLLNPPPPVSPPLVSPPLVSSSSSSSSSSSAGGGGAGGGAAATATATSVEGPTTATATHHRRLGCGRLIRAQSVLMMYNSKFYQ